MITSNSKCLPQILIEFSGYLGTIKGRSQKTCSEYCCDLQSFFRFLKLDRNLVNRDIPFSKIDVSDIDIDFLKTVTLSDVYKYMTFLSSELHNAPVTRARKTSSIRSFFKYLTFTTGKLKENPVLNLDTPKSKRSLPKYLTVEQSREMLRGIDGQFRERDYCILTLFLNCGIRLSELIGINLGDIRSDGTLRVTGKGNKERIVYLNPACIQAIEEYKKVRIPPKRDPKALFISRQGERISRRAVQNIVEKNLSKLGLGGGDGFSTHKLRHTAATLMYQNGVDTRVLKELLGHESLATTEIYTHLSNKQLEDAVNVNPLSSETMKRGNDND